MSESRPYRAGLGLGLEAVTIKSHQLPPAPPESIGSLLLGYDAEHSSNETWKEWNINPAKHGPERMRLPPVFVPSQASYDDLGRSSLDGVGFDIVNSGLGTTSKRSGKIDGEGMADWYMTLSRGGSPGPGHDSILASHNKMKSDIQVKYTRTAVVQGSSTGHTMREERRAHSSEQSESFTAQSQIKSPPPFKVSKPLIIPKREWFIRRALATASNSEPSLEQPPTHTPNPTSISSLLNISTKQPRTAPAHYVLGPDNKGYELLKERLGWEGGGLGRPVGWDEIKERRSSSKRQEGNGHKSKAIEVDQNGNEIVDLTGDSEDDDASATGSRDEVPDDDDGGGSAIGGPGRTAPIATALKIDRLGIGHRFARFRRIKSASKLTQHHHHRETEKDSGKRVTHTIEEIQEAQRRARMGTAVSASARRGLELGRAGRIKWKERDRKDRDERKKLIIALNS